MKKIIALICSAVLVLSLAACGGNGNNTGKGIEETSSEGNDTSTKEVTLSLGYWDTNQKDTLEKVTAAFTEKYPNIKVELEYTPYKGSEYWTKLEASATGGTAPDVFWMNGLHIEVYVEGEMLLPLDTALKDQGIDIASEFPKTLGELYSHDGVQYGVPKDFDTNAVWYNKEIFDNAGVAYPTDDWTWDDMVNIAKQLTDSNSEIYGIAAPIDCQTDYYNTVFAAGGYVLNDDKTASGYTLPGTIKGIQSWIDLINEGISPTAGQLTDTSADAYFESGKLAMVWAGSYMTAEYLGNELIADKINLVETPSFEGKKGNVINGLAYCAYAKSKHPKEAAQLAVFLGSDEAQKIQGEAGAVISAKTNAQQYFAEAQPQINLKAYTNQADIAGLFPCSLVSSELLDIEAQYLAEAYAGDMTVEEACKKIAEEVDPLLQKAYGK